MFFDLNYVIDDFLFPVARYYGSLYGIVVLLDRINNLAPKALVQLPFYRCKEGIGINVYCFFCRAGSYFHSAFFRSIVLRRFVYTGQQGSGIHLYFRYLYPGRLLYRFRSVNRNLRF